MGGEKLKPCHRRRWVKNLKRSRGLVFTCFVSLFVCLFVCLFDCMSVCLSVRSLSLVRFDQLLSYADKRDVNNNERIIHRKEQLVS